MIFRRMLVGRSRLDERREHQPLAHRVSELDGIVYFAPVERVYHRWQQSEEIDLAPCPRRLGFAQRGPQHLSAFDRIFGDLDRRDHCLGDRESAQGQLIPFWTGLDLAAVEMGRRRRKAAW